MTSRQPSLPFWLAHASLQLALRIWPKESRDWGHALAIPCILPGCSLYRRVLALWKPFTVVHFWQAFIAASVGLALFVLARGFLGHKRT